MCGVDARREYRTDGVEAKLLATPRVSAANPQNPPYWTLDTTTDEWVQHQRDGTEICRAPTRRRQPDA